MTRLRRLLLRNRLAAAWLVALALLIKVAVPAGYMPGVEGGTLSLIVCSGTGTQTVDMPMPAHHGPKKAPSGQEMPCAFAGLAAPALAAADPVLLALAILFIPATAAWTPSRRAPAAPPYLRPPLRGPPVSA